MQEKNNSVEKSFEKLLEHKKFIRYTILKITSVVLYWAITILSFYIFDIVYSLIINAAKIDTPTLSSIANAISILKIGVIVLCAIRTISNLDLIRAYVFQLDGEE